MKIVTYNAEWFDRLFDNDGTLRNDEGWSSRWDVTRKMQTDALGAVFKAMNADAIMVIEAPDTSKLRDGAIALETFAKAFGLRARKVMMGYSNDTQQEISFLFDPDVMSVKHAPGGAGTADNPRFDQAILMDVNDDAPPEMITWSKPPLEIDVTVGGKTVHIIGVHAKSKAPHGAETDAEAMQFSIQNRRKQLAQCAWLRERVTQRLADQTPLMVMGDFNDGPGLDKYEKLFGRSGVEIVLGEGDLTPLFDPHAQMVLGQRIATAPTSSRFKKRDGPYLEVLLDYIMVSPDIAATQPKWQIWHPFDQPDCYENVPLREALLMASDHFPVMIDLDL